MRDYSLYLTEFDKFINLIVGSGRVPSESDIDTFVEKMWTKKYWAYDNNNFAGYASTFKGVNGFDIVSGKKVLDIEGLEYSTYISEVKPMLLSKLSSVIGDVTSSSGAKSWQPTPYPLETLSYMYAKQNKDSKYQTMEKKDKRQTEYWFKAEAEINYMKDRIAEYNRKIVPYQLRKTMFHNLTAVHYSHGSGKCWPDRGMVVSGEEDIAPFMDEYVKDTFRSLWFSFSSTGENYKGSVVDIDFHHVEKSEKEKKKVAIEVAKKLQAAGHPVLIQYTGHGYHVWFGRGTGPEFTDRHTIQNLVIRTLGKVQGATTNKTEAIADGIAHLEFENKADQQWAMYFGMHFKPNFKKPIDEETGYPPLPGTGLVRVPLSLDTITTFDPQYDAHPEAVLKNFDKLSLLVDNFFDEIEVGYGHEDPTSLESTPPCLRNENPDPEHPLAVAATEWKKKPAFNEVRWSDALDTFEDETGFTVSPKFNGTLFAIHYKKKGGHRVDGSVLSKSKSIVSRTSGSASLKTPITTIMSTKGGIILWENHITREFEDACIKRGVSEAMFVGELFDYDAFGVVRGPQAITAVVMRKDIEPSAFKQLRYALFDVISIDGQKMDVEYRLRRQELLPYQGDRVRVADMEYIEDGAGPRLTALWNLHVSQNKQEGLVIHHKGKRFKVKEKNTIDVAIIGVNTNSASWLKGRKNRHKFHVAVARTTKYGDPTFIHIGPVNWGLGWDNEKQAELFDMVMGEKISDNKYENTITMPNIDVGGVALGLPLSEIMLVEPKVVVEVEYERLSEGSTPTFGAYYLQETKKASKDRRPRKSGYKLYPQLIQSRRMIGPAQMTRVRDDKDPMNTHDIRMEQADGAGGLEIKRAPRKNPIAVYGYPSWLQKIANLLPIVPSTGSPVGRVLIMDDTMSKMRYKQSPQGFPREEPWYMPIEAYRKLWNFSKRSGRSKEFGGYSIDGNIYYGSSQGRDNLAMMYTSDVYGADFLFHTHPRDHFSPPRYPIISGHDLAGSLLTKYAFGIPWEIIVVPHGFVFFCPRGLKKGSKILKAIEALKKSDSKKTVDRLFTEIADEEKRVMKAYSNARKNYSKIEQERRKKMGFITDHPAWYESSIVEEMNASGDCNVFFDYVYVPLYVLGPNFKKKKFEAIKANPSTGFFGVSKQRETFGSGTIGPEGEPMPKTIKFEKEFEKALDRGRKGEPGFKLYLPRPEYSIQQGKGWPFVLGLPMSMQMDFADMYGGPGANRVAMLSSDAGNIRAHTEQLSISYKNRDSRQGKNDNMLFTIQAFQMPKKEENPEVSSGVPTQYDEGTGNRRGEFARQLDGAQKGFKFTNNKEERRRHLQNLYDSLGVKSNPPTGIQEWDNKVAEFRKDYADFVVGNLGAGQSWADYISYKHPEWEFALLEKGRLLMDAIDLYTLTDEEEARVRQEYSSISLDLDNPLGNLLASLDEDDEADDEDEEGGDEVEEETE